MSAAPSVTRTRKALIIAGTGFEDTEFFYPYYRLQEADFYVDVCTHNDQAIVGKIGLTASPTITIDDLAIAHYDVAVIPGGHEGPDRVRQVAGVLQFIRRAVASDTVIASICHGPWVLVSAGVASGRRMTCYKGCKDDIINAGAEWIDQPVVVDGRLVTAQHFRDNGAWMRDTLRLLGS